MEKDRRMEDDLPAEDTMLYEMRIPAGITQSIVADIITKFSLELKKTQMTAQYCMEQKKTLKMPRTTL